MVTTFRIKGKQRAYFKLLKEVIGRRKDNSV